MTKLQLSIIGVFTLLFLILYFGFDTKSNEQERIEKSRAQRIETLSVDNLLKEAQANIPAEKVDIIHFYNKEIEKTNDDSVRISYLKNLSSEWYNMKEYAIAGKYAFDVAELTDTEQAWSITGSTFAIGAKNYSDQKKKDYCTNNAIQAFENAASINPENINHRLNIGLCLTDNPPKENPMQGVQMLLELNKKYPESIPVLIQLARLGMKTGQFEKAVQRLIKVLSLDENNKRANCMIVDAYSALNDKVNAALYEKKCLEFN